MGLLPGAELEGKQGSNSCSKTVASQHQLPALSNKIETHFESYHLSNFTSTTFNMMEP